MQEDFIVRDARQLQMLGNPIRVRMLEHLCREPLTATQLGHLMGMAPARAHYHLKRLTEVGLTELLEIREQAGVMEKYYQAIARRFHFDKTVAHGTPGGPPRHPLLGELQTAFDGLERRLAAPDAVGNNGTLPHDVAGGVTTLHLTPARYERLLNRLTALLREFEIEGSPPAGTTPYALLLAIHREVEPPAVS